MSTRRPLRVLHVEDAPDDSVLLERELRRGGLEPTLLRVEDRESMAKALAERSWDVIVSDFSVPGFGALEALRLVQEIGLDLPFLIVSGTIGEIAAVDAMKAGAHDYLLKGSLARLVPAIEREMREAMERAERRRASAALDASVRALQRSEERVRALVSSIDDFVFTVDESLRYTGVYGRWIGVEGYEPDQMLGRTVGEVFGAEAAEAHRAAYAAALRGERVSSEWSFPGADGPRELHTTFAALTEVGTATRELVGVARETTEQRRLREQLFVSDRMASVGTLATGVAHEINNPLAIVLANLDFARMGIGPLAEHAAIAGDPTLESIVRDLETTVSEAREAADRVRFIVRDLRIFGRAGDEDEIGPVDLRSVMDSSVRMAWNEIRHRAKLVKDYDGSFVVEGNEPRLGQVFLNLVVNAAQAIPEGRAYGNEIRISARRLPDSRVCVEVADSGVGIAPEHLARIFNPFFTTKPVGVGTGLGLAICQRIVANLGGQISVESELGRGTTFRVVLRAAAFDVQPAAKLDDVIRPPTRRARVLVIDDEPMMGSAIVRALSVEHDADRVGHAQDALDRIESGEHFDVILCDLMMPDIGGADFYDALRERHPELLERIIFLTGGAFTARARAFLEEVDNLRLEKTFDVQHLRTIIGERVR